MKRIFTIAFALMACIATINAWTPSDTDYRLMDLDSVYGQSLLKSVRADNGVIYQTWLRTPKGVMASDSTFGYFLHLQIFDPSGNPLFGKEGILVSDNPTKTYVSDYGVALAPNGDIVITYADCRYDAAKRASIHSYVYRFDQQGNPVWNADGTVIPVQTTDNTLISNYEMKNSVMVSGDNIYVMTSHTEVYRNENNKKVTVSNFQVNRMNNDGTFAWSENVLFNTSLAMVKMAPCADGDVFVLYDNDSKGISARRLNKDGAAVWNEDVVVESELLGNYFMNEPTVVPDDKGGIVLVYRKLMSFTGYAAYNYLRADGTTLGTGASMTGSTDGDCGSLRAALNGDSLLVAWSYEDTVYNMYANSVSVNDGSFLWPTWPFDYSKGVSYDQSPSWGITPITVIRMTDGWVIFYANSVSYNAANLYVIKIDDFGSLVWSKQICEDNFVANSYSIVNDDKYAYFFIATDEEYDTDKGGGMRVMCIELSDGSTPRSGVDEINAVANGVETRYDLSGREVSADHKGIQIVKSADGTVKKVLVK